MSAVIGAVLALLVATGMPDALAGGNGAGRFACRNCRRGLTSCRVGVKYRAY
jgi:hypothetical protein